MIPFDEYYWYLKRQYPGDLEFSYDRYWELPYYYVLSAVESCRKLRLQELHENEVPLSLIACQQAEINRDRKSRKKPYELSDFYCYDIDADKDSIDARYGSAASALISMGLFPRWGLFIYKELMKNASNTKAPDILAYINESAIILAPVHVSGMCKGMLIGLEGISYRNLTFDIIKGDSIQVQGIRIRMPRIDGKTVAIENCMMDIVG